MNFSFYIAERYLFSKKNRNAVNIISGISVAVVTVSTAALVIVLSSINGFGDLINNQISKYAPDLKIEAVKGKTFEKNKEKFEQIKNIPQIKYIADIIEDNALIKYDNKQEICTAKGIPDDYDNYFNLNQALREGIFKTSGKKLNYAVIGGGIAYKLGLSVKTQKAVSLWMPDRKNVNLINPERSFKHITLIPSGIIAVDNEFDLKYILTSLNLLRKITDRDNNTVSSIEIKIKKNKDINSTKEKIKKILGKDFNVKDVYEQFDVYKVMKSERLAAFVIMLFIILISSFSIAGSLTMLIIEKKRDIFTLISMGSDIKSIRKIFFTSGILISFFGAFTGVVAGTVICLLQQKYGLVTFPSDGMYIVDAYPVSIKISDLILSFFSVIAIGIIISLYPAIKIKDEYFENMQNG